MKRFILFATTLGALICGFGSEAEVEKAESVLWPTGLCCSLRHLLSWIVFLSFGRRKPSTSSSALDRKRQSCRPTGRFRLDPVTAIMLIRHHHGLQPRAFSSFCTWPTTRFLGDAEPLRARFLRLPVISLLRDADARKSGQILVQMFLAGKALGVASYLLDRLLL